MVTLQKVLNLLQNHEIILSMAREYRYVDLKMCGEGDEPGSLCILAKHQKPLFNKPLFLNDLAEQLAQLIGVNILFAPMDSQAGFLRREIDSVLLSDKEATIHYCFDYLLDEKEATEENRQTALSQLQRDSRFYPQQQRASSPTLFVGREKTPTAVTVFLEQQAFPFIESISLEEARLLLQKMSVAVERKEARVDSSHSSVSIELG